MLKKYISSFLWVAAVFGSVVHPRPATAAVLPPGRGTTWNPGIPGGIPPVTTIYTTINAVTYGNGVTDATAAINSAIQAAGNRAATTGVRQVVYLPAGTYRTTGPVDLNRDDVVLRGAGASLTRIRLNTSDGTSVIRIGKFWPSYAAVVNVTTNVPKGATSITVANATGFQVGDVLQIDQLDDARYVLIGDGQYNKRGPGQGDPASAGWRSVAQQVEIASKSGNVLGLSGPTHIAFNLAFDPEVFKTATARSGEPGTRYAGLEDLYVTGGNNNQIWALNVAYCWVRNVESDGNPATGPGMTGIHVELEHAYRCEVRGSFFHHARSINPGGGAYGISIALGSSDNLIENNICRKLNKPLTLNVSGGGNVIAYNYVDEAMIAYAPAWQETGVDSHVSFAHDDLFEGNWTPNIGAQSTHGNSGWLTYFRNFARGRNSSNTPTQFVHAVLVDHHMTSFNVVGNVLLAEHPTLNGYAPIYEHSSDLTSPEAAAVYDIGGWSGDWDSGQALSTLYRHGNYDYVTNSVVWDEGNPDHALPSSLYLTSKPAFFGALAWPWVTPAAATKVATLPAKARFDAGVPIPHVVVTSISPVTGPIAGGTTVTIHGNGFAAGATVSLGGVTATGVVLAGPTTLTAVTGAHSTGLADVRVTIPAIDPATLAQAFFYSLPPTPSDFYTVTPCRLVDTRTSQGPALATFERRVWKVTGKCAVPATAKAVAINVTVVGATAPGHIRLAPGNGLTETSAINFNRGQTRANNALVRLATDATGGVAATNRSAGTVQLILDVSGYFE